MPLNISYTRVIWFEQSASVKKALRYLFELYLYRGIWTSNLIYLSYIKTHDVVKIIGTRFASQNTQTYILNTQTYIFSLRIEPSTPCYQEKRVIY